MTEFLAPPEEDRRRLEWLRASMEITQQLLAADGVDPLELTARRALRIADADVVSVSVPTPDSEQLTVVIAVGEGAGELLGLTFEVAGSLSGMTFRTGRAMLVADATGDRRAYLAKALPVGPVMVVPLTGGQRVRGALALGRRLGRAPFDSADLDMATSFAGQATVALELADARADQQRMNLLEERDRIARDLHDNVIQRLFAAGLTLQSMDAGPDPAAQAKLTRVVEGIDETIAQIRTTIFGLRGRHGPSVGTLRSRVLATLGQGQRPGPRPAVRFLGPVDTSVPENLVDAVEALIHLLLAGPGFASVTVAARDGLLRVELECAADGPLLDRIRLAAEQLGGKVEVVMVTGRLLWEVPLR